MTSFPDPEKPFFSLMLPDGRDLVCLFGRDDLEGYEPYPEFEIVAGIDDQDPHRFGNLRRDDGLLVLRMADGDVGIPVDRVTGTSASVDVDDRYVTILAVEGEEPRTTRNLPSFYRSIHHARRRREHREMLEFAAA